MEVNKKNNISTMEIRSQWMGMKKIDRKQKNKDNSKEKSAIKYKRKPIISQCWGGLGLILYCR